MRKVVIALLVLLNAGAIRASAEGISPILGKWVWASGMGPAILSIENISADGEILGTYGLTEYPQHTSVFSSNDKSSAAYSNGLLEVRLKSGSKFALTLVDGELLGDFTFSRDGSVTTVTFNKMPGQ
jgi:hypothetical protein